MKRRGCLLVVLLAIGIMGFTMNVEAAEIVDRGYCGGEGDGTNLSWTLDSDGVLVIEGQGRMRDWTEHDQIKEWYGSSVDIYSVIIRNGVINIGDGAFYWGESITSVELPETLTSIGDEAFYWCDITSINLPEALTSIGDYAFYDNWNLSSIDLPKSLTSIGDWTFSGCSSLSSIDLPETLTSLGDGAFLGCDKLSSIDLPESITSIGNNVFEDCSSLISIVIPESVTRIGDWAFAYCTNLRSINLPEKLTSIGDRAFSNCYKLGNIGMPELLTSIGDNAFEYCTNLDSIYIPASIDTIYRSAFAYTNLKVIYYGGTKEQWNNVNIIRGDSEDTGYILPDIHCVDDDIDYEKLKEFVSRLYGNFLKREPDEKGLADWINALQSGKATGAKVVVGFVLSPEYKANVLGNEEYVTALYRIIFEREPDADGLKSWLAVMEKGYTYKKVLAGFINSDEFSNLCEDLGIMRGSYKSDEPVDQSNNIEAFVARLYKVCLGRAYDQDGLDNWVRALTDGTTDVRSVVVDFFNSQEFYNRNLDNTEFVTVAYQTVLNREPDKSGLEYWMNNLSWGDTRDEVLYGIMGSKEFWRLCREYGI